VLKQLRSELDEAMHSNRVVPHQLFNPPQDFGFRGFIARVIRTDQMKFGSWGLLYHHFEGIAKRVNSFPMP
jgi:hypothetical protein